MCSCGHLSSISKFSKKTHKSGEKSINVCLEGEFQADESSLDHEPEALVLREGKGCDSAPFASDGDSV